MKCVFKCITNATPTGEIGSRLMLPLRHRTSLLYIRLNYSKTVMRKKNF